MGEKHIGSMIERNSSNKRANENQLGSDTDNDKISKSYFFFFFMTSEKFGVEFELLLMWFCNHPHIQFVPLEKRSVPQTLTLK